VDTKLFLTHHQRRPPTLPQSQPQSRTTNHIHIHDARNRKFVAM